MRIITTQKSTNLTHSINLMKLNQSYNEQLKISGKKTDQYRLNFYSKLIQVKFTEKQEKQGKPIVEILLMLLMPLLQGLSIIDSVVRIFKYFVVILLIFFCLFVLNISQFFVFFQFVKWIVFTFFLGGGVFLGGLAIRGMGKFSGFSKKQYACVGFIGDGQTHQISKFLEKKIGNELILWRNTALDLSLYQILDENWAEAISQQKFEKNQVFSKKLVLNIENIIQRNKNGVLSQKNRDEIMQFVSGGLLSGKNIPNQWFYIDQNSSSSGWQRLCQRVEMDGKQKINALLQDLKKIN
eukprot:TRINITY_DN10594_c1_g1_i1.p1 TRINITY_DN10594_c1_g1~~TRINITY_DN10594_c1_g1_i1.p1  ORF type:complete len:296 (+),score=55.61 TRINITY_DN10594_c1_g1_i1:96-983(+)